MLLNSKEIRDAVFSQDTSGNIARKEFTTDWKTGSINNIWLPTYSYNQTYLGNFAGDGNILMGASPPAVSPYSNPGNNWFRNLTISNDSYGIFSYLQGTGSIGYNFIWTAAVAAGVALYSAPGVLSGMYRNVIFGDCVLDQQAGSTTNIGDNFIFGRGSIISNGVDNSGGVQNNMILSSVGARSSNQIINSSQNAIIQSLNVDIQTNSQHNVVIGVDGLVITSQNNTGAPRTYIGKLHVGRGTAGALATTGATHGIGYNSSNGELIRTELPVAPAFLTDVNGNIEPERITTTIDWGNSLRNTAIGWTHPYYQYFNGRFDGDDNILIGFASPYVTPGMTANKFYRNITISPADYDIEIDLQGATNVFENTMIGSVYVKSQLAGAGQITRNIFVTGSGNYEIETDVYVNNGNVRGNMVFGPGIIKLKTSNTERNSILGSWGISAIRNKIYDSQFNTMVGGFSNEINNLSRANTIVGAIGVTISGKNNQTTPTVYMPRLVLGRGTGGALLTTGETHALAYNSTTGAVIRTALAGTEVNTISNVWKFTNSSISNYQSPTNSINFATGTNFFGGNRNTLLGFKHSSRQSFGTVSYNLHLGNNESAQITANSTGTGQIVDNNIMIGSFHNVRNITTAGNTNIIEKNILIGRSNDIVISGTVGGNDIDSNLLIGTNVDINSSNGTYSSGTFLGGNGMNVTMNTANYSMRDNFVWDTGLWSLTKGYMTDSVIMSNQNATLSGSIYSAVVMGNKGILGFTGVWESAILANEIMNISSSAPLTQVIGNSLIAASRVFQNAGFTFLNSALIAVDGFTMTANIANTVLMPKLRLGRGSNGALPTTGQTRLLAYNASNGDVVSVPALYTATVTLTQAQIQALNTTPITLVAAPGANKVIEVVSVSVTNNFNTAAFATATQVRLKDSGGSNRLISSTSFVTAAAKRIEQMVPVAAAVPSLVNTALVVDADADATAGNAASTIDVDITYKILDV